MTPLTDAERDELNALLSAGTALPEKWLHRLFPNGRKIEHELCGEYADNWDPDPHFLKMPAALTPAFVSQADVKIESVHIGVNVLTALVVRYSA